MSYMRFHLCGKKESLKQNSWDAIRVWWAPILAKGKLHIELLGGGFPSETPEGAALLVAKVRAALNVRFQGCTPPSTIFTDRGQGFYRIKGGKITPEYKAALTEHGLEPYYGDDASIQPGNLQEVLLHETAVAWIRAREPKTRPVQPWTVTPEGLGKRLREICKDINDNCDVEGLRRKLPKRIQKVADNLGDRINH